MSLRRGAVLPGGTAPTNGPLPLPFVPQAGAPVTAFADCKRAAVAFTQGAPKRFASSPGVWRGFCAHCGSTLSFEWDGRPDEIALHIGAFDDPDALPPTGPDTFPEERVSWLHLAQ